MPERSEAPSPAIIARPDGASPILLLGDHAGCEIPAGLGDLGLTDHDRSRHIAWDIGVAGMGRALSSTLDATFIRQRFSRLVIDCNRDPEREDAIPPVSDRTVVPGNAALSPEARQERVETVWRPYHDAIALEVDRRLGAGRPPVVVALHSFTPRMDGYDRPWLFGVLCLDRPALSLALLDLLRAEPDLGPDRVGDNQPYAMDGIDYTIPRHAIARGLPYLEIEVRQDLMADPAGEQAVAARLARLLPAAIAAASA